MAEATFLRNNALDYPIYGAPFTIVFPIFDVDGGLITSAAGLDSEVSLNADTFADCTNEATEIATDSGIYYLSITATEMTSDIVAGIVKSTTNKSRTTPFTLYPRKLPTVHSGTSAGGDVAYITLDSAASAADDYYNGMVCIATIDSNVECRVIADYDGSSRQAAVTPNWNVTPDADDTFVIKLPEGVQIPYSDRMAAVLFATPWGIVVDDNDPDPTTTAFETTLTEASDDHYNNAFVLFYSGNLTGQSRKISDYDGTNKIVTVATAFTEAPAADDAFVILGRSE